MFPNPSSTGYINVSWSQVTEGARLSLKDNAGRTIRTSYLGANESKISTEGLPTGLYHLEVLSAAARKQAQVVIR